MRDIKYKAIRGYSARIDYRFLSSLDENEQPFFFSRRDAPLASLIQS